MAKVIVSDKGFKIIECTREEIIKHFNGYGICDSCNNAADKGYYIAVLNQWYCHKCYIEWYQTARNYERDQQIEELNFERYQNIINNINRIAEIIKIIEDALIVIEANEKKYKGNGFILATHELDYCVVDNGKGINGTNIAAHLTDPYVFSSMRLALENKRIIKATNKYGKIKFFVWYASDYWDKVKERFTDLLKSIKTNNNL